MTERGEGCLDHVVRVRRTDRFGDDILHAERLEDRPHRAAGDNAGAGLGRPNDYLAGAVAVGDIMVQGAALAQRHADHAAPRLLGRLADRLRHLARLAGAVADPALFVADDDERREAEPPAAFDDLCNAVDVDQLFGELAFLAVARRAVAVAPAPFTLRACHRASLRNPARPRGRRRPGLSPGHDTYRRRDRTRRARPRPPSRARQSACRPRWPPPCRPPSSALRAIPHRASRPPRAYARRYRRQSGRRYGARCG